MHMNVEHAELYERICQFKFDAGDEELTFAKRLAKENGWSLPYAERAIDEYRRFMFLACTAEHCVTPSDQVDQVWHLHLVYTQSYWNDWCRNTLKREVHHGPTKGGQSQRDTHTDLYEKTLATYQTFLGELPPTDIWPPTALRFGDDVHYTRVNTRRNWVIRKPRFRSAIVAAIALPCFALFGDQSLLDSPYGIGLLIAAVIGILIAASFLYMDGDKWFNNRGGGGGCSTGCSGCSGCSGCGGCSD